MGAKEGIEKPIALQLLLSKELLPPQSWARRKTNFVGNPGRFVGEENLQELVFPLAIFHHDFRTYEYTSRLLRSLLSRTQPFRCLSLSRQYFGTVFHISHASKEAVGSPKILIYWVSPMRSSPFQKRKARKLFHSTVFTGFSDSQDYSIDIYIYIYGHPPPHELPIAVLYGKTQ